MKTIFDYVNAKEIATFWKLYANEKQPLLGATLFPAKKQIGLDLKWVKGSKGLPIELSVSAFDSKAPLRDRIGFETMHTEMPFFKESMLITETERQELNKVIASGNQTAIDMIVSKIYEDKTTLIEGAEATAERMRMQLLSEGKISIIGKKADGTPHTFDYDYGLDSSQKVDSSDWTNKVNADPLADIEKWIDSVVERTGNRPTRAICTSKVFGYLKNNQNIADMFKTVGKFVTAKGIKEYISDELGITIVTYDKKYQDKNGNSKTYLDDSVFVLLPDGNLGNTMYGTTPEESDLMSSSVANVQIVNTGVAVTTTNQVDPVNVSTKVSMISLPSFENADNILIAKVDGTSF